MADEPEKNQRLELRYRAGREDMRPKSDADLGCAIVFSLIALVMLLGIAVIVRYQWRRITAESIVPIAGLGLFAAGSIIAVCGRLTRHRWWGNRDWKEDWRPPRNRKEGG